MIIILKSKIRERIINVTILGFIYTGYRCMNDWNHELRPISIMRENRVINKYYNVYN